MQKRPIGIYFIAAWLFFHPFALGIYQPLGQLLQQANLAGEPALGLRAAAGVMLVFIVLLIFGLIQLRPLYCNTAIVLFALHSVALIYQVPLALQRHPGLGLGLVAVTAVRIVGNGLAIWYLRTRVR